MVQRIALAAVLGMALAAMAGCGSGHVSRGTANPLQEAALSGICTAYAQSSNALERQMYEVELVSRRVLACPGQRIGVDTAARLGQPQFVRSPRPPAGVLRPARSYRCRDFATAMAAQRMFLLSGGPVHDLYRLDPDGDGLACDYGRQIAGTALMALPPG